MSNDNNIQNSNNDEIDIKDLVLFIWSKKFFITILTSIAAVISVLYALSLPNIYTSKALLSPVNENSSLSSQLAGMSTLARLGGVNIGSGGTSPSKEAIERMKSYEFFENHFLPNIKLENLLAAKRWDQSTDMIIYNDKIYDSVSEEWTRKVRPPLEKQPSNQEAYEAFKKIFLVSMDIKTDFVSVSIKHLSPNIAKKWLDIIIFNINEKMREEDRKLALDSINFLNKSSEETNLVEIKEAISQLLQSEMQKLMLAAANENYIYKKLESPIAPERKSEPKRSLICILGTLIGGMFGVLITIFQYSRRNT